MYKLKITSTNKKPKMMPWELGPEDPNAEFMIKSTLKIIKTTLKAKVTSCRLFKNDGTFVKSYNHLIDKK